MALEITSKINLTNNDEYKNSTIELLNKKYSNYESIYEIEKQIPEINSYINLDKIQEPKDIFTFDEEKITKEEIILAKQNILEGSIFFEHTAAGEATRLGLGTKYLINISKSLTLDKIKEMIELELDKTITTQELLEQSTCLPNELLSLSLGSRHMIQLAFDIYKLSKEENKDPRVVLAKQKMLIILNEKTYEQILDEFVNNKFYGFDPSNIFFMVQKSFYGISKDDDGFYYDKTSEKRLHNHGQMVMQETLDDEIFYLDEEYDFEKRFLTSNEFGEILKKCNDKISYNIEDIGYLTNSIDYQSLAIALKLKEQGYNMIMEIVANNPIKPQKGGMAAFDPILNRNVMIESFQLEGIKNEDIKYLNKNFNHYPNPYIAWKKLKDEALPMPICIKHNHIYFQPVQGDINFRVNTQFVRRKILKPIENWKSPATTPATIAYMKKQDLQSGFKDFIREFLDIRFD
jgi:hypothetical protein